MLKLTRKDICSALKVSEYRIRAWMEREPFKLRSTAARKARTFDMTDLILLAIAQTLEDKYRLRGEGLDPILPALDVFLRRPQRTGVGLIFINLRDWSVEEISSNTYFESGFLFDLLPDQERVTRYLGLTPAQAELAFGLTPMNQINE